MLHIVFEFNTVFRTKYFTKEMNRATLIITNQPTTQERRTTERERIHGLSSRGGREREINGRQERRSTMEGETDGWRTIRKGHSAS